LTGKFSFGSEIEMTKTKLLASTMLVAASTMIAAGSANALKLKVGGFGEFWAGYADNDAAGNVNSNFDVKNDAEITFRGEETLDNGMKVGVLFELEAGVGAPSGAVGAGNTESGFDEAFAWVKASWGQVNIGNNDLATGYTGGVSVVGPVGIIKSDASDWIPGNGELNNTDGDVGLGDAGNITYFTPRVAGFQAIVSYTPDSSDANTSAFDNQETTGRHNGLSGALKYGGKFGGAKIGLSAGYTHAEESDAAAGGNATAEAWNAAGSVDFGKFKITAAYAHENTADMNEFWGAGVIYKMTNADTVSLGYGRGEETQKGVGVGDNSEKVITLGYERNLGKGVALGASLFKVSRSGGGLTALQLNDGMGFVTGLKLKF
jgi:outer membrane protein OmpU